MKERKDGGKIKVTRVLVERLISVRKRYDIHSPLFSLLSYEKYLCREGREGKKRKDREREEMVAWARLSIQR